jgi:steroid delta-isomerase
MTARQALEDYAALFAQLTPVRLTEFEQVFAPDARFKDPFNDVRGVAAIRQVFEHMYATVDDPRFVVLDQACEERIGYLHWQFLFRSGKHQRRIHGMSRVVFDSGGLVVEHIDFWDPAEQLYEAIPVLGSIMRWLRGRLSASKGSNA